jgi:hypothetical protein
LVLRGALAWVLVAAVVRLVVLQPERCGDVSPGDVEQATAAAVAWLVDNQRPDGSFLYRYHRGDAADEGGYNTVRHAGAIVALEQAATFGHPGAAEAADRATGWALARTVEVPDAGRALSDEQQPDLVPSGATGLWLAALVERRERTGDPTHDELLADLGRFMVSMVTADGAVLGRYDRALEAPVPQSWSRFYTGEVFWALAGLHLAFPDAGYDDPTERIGTYLATRRDEVEGWWPTLPDHWAAYGFATMVRWPERAGDHPLTEDQVTYLREQAALQSAQIRYESQRTDSWWTHLTRGRPTLGAGLATIGEGLVQLWAVAGADARLADLRPAIAERTRCTVGVMVERQVTPDAAGRWGEPERVAGAWFQFDVTQVDDQQHAVSALLYAEDIVAAGR